MSHSRLDKPSNGMFRKQYSVDHQSSSSKVKSPAMGFNASDGQSSQVGVRMPAFGTHGRISNKISSHPVGNPSISVLSSPSGKTLPQDSDSDDEKPIIFSKQPLSSTSPKAMQNGIGLSHVNTEIPKNFSAIACEHYSRCSDESDEDDNAPLASRVVASIKHLSEISRHSGNDGDSDEDDEKPLVLKRPINGPLKSVKQMASLVDSSLKKRPSNADSKELSANKKTKLMENPLLKPTNILLGSKQSSITMGSNLSKTQTESKPAAMQLGSKSPNITMLKSTSTPSGTEQVSASTPTKLPSMVTAPHPRPPSSINKAESHTPRPLKPFPAVAPKLSPSGLSKPSTASKIVSKHSIALKKFEEVPRLSSVHPKPSVALLKTSGTSMSSVVKSEMFNSSIGLPKSPDAHKDPDVKMEIDEDEDEDEVPLARRIPVPKLQKMLPVKKPVTSLTSSVAARKLVEAKKAKLKMQQKMIKKVHRGSKNIPPGSGGGQKWTTLEHNGVIFPPPYSPHGIKVLYKNKPVMLTPEQEEVATMFAVMRDTDYVTKPKFLSNFWNDWKKILGPGHVVQSLDDCDFTPIYEWHLAEKEKKKSLSSEEKKRIKEEKQKQEEKYMWALVDGVKEKVGNFRVEPPGLFRGRGEHPKMGKLKRRIFPEDIIINIGENAPVPECPMPGHRWKDIRHDNNVTWLAFWNDPINSRECKYVFLAASSSLKGQSDREKYEKARTLKDYIEDIRKTYTRNFSSPDMVKRQIAVATYLIDRLALRAGNEKDDDEADTVGCCSLKVGHVTLIPPRSLQFDFLGKDSIRYFNTVEVEEQVYKAIGDFKKSKKMGRDLFDKLDTSKLNAHLKDIMPQLTAKVFRTYNASITLDRLLVDTDGVTVQEKIVAYQNANKEVAILCNHQRSVSKLHGAQMERLEGKMAELEELLKELRVDLDRAERGKPPLKDADGKPKRNQNPESLLKKIAQTEQRIEKMRLDMKTKDDLKTVALGTSKINYMDPRITVAWCKRHEVPIEKIFNKSLLAKFAWAMDVDLDYRF